MEEKRRGTFGRVFWPSLVANLVVTIIAFILFIVVVFGIIGSFSSGDEMKSVSKNTILHLELKDAIAENSSSQFSPTSFSMDNKLGLSDILFGLKEAAKDKDIKGVFIEIQDLQCGYGTAREIRNAIKDFKKSGKWLIAYNGGEVITQKEYYVSSVVDDNYAFPTSMMEFLGLGAELMYFKNTLDKLDVEMQVIRGKNNDFKSAVEPFFRDSMSDSSRLQIETYLSSMWGDIRSDIAADRKVSVETLNDIAENSKIQRAEDAVGFKLLKATKYRDEIYDMLRKKVGVKADEDLKLFAFNDYAKDRFYDSQAKMIASKDANIAIVLAEGGVATDGEGVSSKKICEYFKKIRANDKIKTVVFRINSPGGSALASDEIWREVKLTNLTKKVIVSMGDVAASGGYYVAAPAYRIFAEPTTITGSIGVFGVIPYTGAMFENKLGITFDRAATNSHSVLTLNRKLTEAEFQIIQNEVDEIYQDFLERVAEGRKMTTEDVNKIARGRVWTGRDAMRIGLVDEMGGLNEALAFAIKNAKIKDAKILYYPEKKLSPFEKILASFGDDSEEAEMTMKSNEIPKELLLYWERIKEIESFSGIQMRLPYSLDIR